MWNQIQTLDDASLVVLRPSRCEITRGRRGRERANRQKKGGGGGGGGSRICAHLLNFSFWRFSTPFFSLEKIKGRVFLGGGVKKEGGDLKRDLIGALLLNSRTREEKEAFAEEHGRTTPKTAFFVDRTFLGSPSKDAPRRVIRAFKIVCFFPREIEVPFKNLPKKELNPVPGKNQTSPLCRHRIER